MDIEESSIVLPSGLHIIVVDDLAAVRKVVTRILGTLGLADVTEARDGVEAWEAIERRRPDVIITDWEMPRLSGYDLVKRLKASDEFKQIPILLITSRGERERVVAAAEAGASDFIVKPFNEAILREKIWNAIQHESKSVPDGEPPAP